jgi:hypothetical protein
MAVCDVVIIGSYPPMPGPPTAATLAAVRRAWDDGSVVRVVSFRPGAADISVPVVGPLAGWRLEQIRRHYGGPLEVVLGLQPGVPFSSSDPLEEMATAVGLAIALHRFKRASLVVGEDPAISPAAFKVLAHGAGECVVSTHEARRRLEERYHLRPGLVVVEEVEPYPALAEGSEPPSSGLYGPGSGRGLTVVELPTTTLSQRARTRAHLARSSLLRRLRAH